MPPSDAKFALNLLAVIDARLRDERKIIRNERLPAKFILRERAKNCPSRRRATIRIAPKVGGALRAA
jgi:hypothetical protein